MEQIVITDEKFRQALCWINGQASTLGEKEVSEMLRSLTNGFRENCRRLRPGPIPRFRSLTPSPLSLSALMAEALPEEAACPVVPLPETPKEEINDEPSSEVNEPPCRLDSVLLLNSIAYVSAMAGYQVTQSRAQIILYCLYGSRLGAGKDRLDIEHPQMWKYGPVFPRAFKRSNIDDRGICEESYNGLMGAYPSLLTSLSTKTQAMMATPMADLNAVHKGAGSPYARTLMKYPEKWGTQIPDEEIAAFFRKRLVG